MVDEIFNLPVPHRMNKQIINYLGLKEWAFVNDSDRKFKNSFYDIISNPSIKDAGQAIISYKKNDNSIITDSILNFFGEFIFSLIQEKSRFKIKEIDRMYWNLYTPSSECQFHFDNNNIGRYVSAVYNLHTNDGGTQIENEFVTSVESQAVIFKSEKVHKGISSKTSNLRLNLNIVMEL